MTPVSRGPIDRVELSRRAAPAARPVLHRLRGGLLTAAGLLCGALLLIHLALTVPGGGAAGGSGIVGETFVSAADPRR